jgi:hypothetical protein
MRIAYYGYRIVEIRNGARIEHYPHRTVKTFDVARVRVISLCHDRKYKHLPERKFEIWDGVTPVSVLTVTKTEIFEKPYLLQPRNGREQIQYDRDYELSIRNRRKNQKVGRDASDISSWIKQKPLDPELCKMIYPSGYVSKQKDCTRLHENHDRMVKSFVPGESKDREWLVKHNLIDPTRWE